MFGKLMSISDETMWLYFDLLSFKSIADIQALKEKVKAGMNPRDVKFILGEEIVDRFHGVGAGVAAREHFIAQFQQGRLPDDMPEVEVSLTENGVSITHLMKEIGLVEGTTEAGRLIQQGGVKVDGEKMSDKNLHFKEKKSIILQVGKRRFAKVTFS
jgi:tyrosyl-tRNA synthetase